jgi:DNA-binding beta-propeller fold protein YncE
MNKLIVWYVFLCVCPTLAVHTNAQDRGIYTLDKEIMLPGNDGYDYLFADQENRRLYVSHGTTVHVLDLDAELPVGVVPGLQGAHGISIVAKKGLGFIADGKANAVQVFDLKTLHIVKTIPLSGIKPDAILFDVFTNQLVVFNNGSNNASVVDIATLKEKALITLPGAPEFAASDAAGLIYCNLEDRNEMVVINAKSLRVADSVSFLPNGTPTSIFFDKQHKRVFSGCRQGNSMAVVDIVTRKVTASVSICKGVDAIVYDDATSLIFCSGDGTTSVIKQINADQYTLVQTINTGTRAKTMAIDLKTHKIYISVADYEPGSKKIIPGTFRLLVYKIG